MVKLISWPCFYFTKAIEVVMDLTIGGIMLIKSKIAISFFELSL